MQSAAAYLAHIPVLPERIQDPAAFPFSLPFVPGLELTFQTGVTFFVGATGSGKSTVL